MFDALNNKPVANAGLAMGLGIVSTAVYGLFRIVSDPDELIALYEAAHTHSDPTHAVAKLAGAGLGVVGATIIALLAAYQGKPSTIS